MAKKKQTKTTTRKQKPRLKRGLWDPVYKSPMGKLPEGYDPSATWHAVKTVPGITFEDWQKEHPESYPKHYRQKTRAKQKRAQRRR